MITYRKPDTISRAGRHVGVMSLAVAALALAAAGCSSNSGSTVMTAEQVAYRRRPGHC